MLYYLVNNVVAGKKKNSWTIMKKRLSVRQPHLVFTTKRSLKN